MGLGIALGLPQWRRSALKVSGDAYLQYRFYDAAGRYTETGQRAVAGGADGWQALNLLVQVPRKGFVQLVLGNASPAPVWFDDLALTVGIPAERRPPKTVVGGPPAWDQPTTNHECDCAGSPTDPNPDPPTSPPTGGGGDPGYGTPITLPEVPIVGTPPPPPPVILPPGDPAMPPPQSPTNPFPTNGGGGGGSGPTPVFVHKMPGVMMRQTTNSTCVTSAMAEISKAICSPPTSENTIDHWAAAQAGLSIYDFLFTPKGGVPLSNINSLINNFFTTTPLPVPLTIQGVQNALSAGRPIMMDIPSDASGVKHNIVITGFDPLDSNALFYLDPLTGTTRIGKLDAMFKQADYATPISGCK